MTIGKSICDAFKIIGVLCLVLWVGCFIVAKICYNVLLEFLVMFYVITYLDLYSVSDSNSIFLEQRSILCGINFFSSDNKKYYNVVIKNLSDIEIKIVAYCLEEHNILNMKKQTIRCVKSYLIGDCMYEPHVINSTINLCLIVVATIVCSFIVLLLIKTCGKKIET